MNFTEYISPVGNILLQSDGEHLTGLWIGRENSREQAEDSVIKKTKLWLDSYFRGENPAVEIPIKLHGTEFQQQVWKILQEIPYGQIRTYGDIAREMALLLGKEKMSAQAVGQAVGKNPVSILVPCHRVVGTKGQLTGYAWGVEKKQWLLRHEGWRQENSIK